MVTLYKFRALDEHAARSARGVENAAPKWLQDFHDQADDGVRREVLPTAFAFLRSEIRQEVLVDKAERVAFQLGGQRGEQAQQLDERRPFQLLIPTRQDVLELRVGGLDRLDCFVDGLAYVVAFGQVDEVGKSRFVGDVEHRLGLVVGDGRRVALGGFGLDLAADSLEAVLGVR